MRKQRGFSLIELLIVIAIILIIAAIAIPSLMRSRMLANQSAAASTVRTLVTAQSSYFSTFGAKQGYAPAIANLGVTAPPAPCAPGVVPTFTAACLIDPVLTQGAKGGYLFEAVSYNPTATLGPQNFTVDATPATPATTGNVDYCATDDGVVYFRTPPVGLNGPAICAPPYQPLQN